jgi:DNA-binding MarR family transcriptional regulator
MRQHHSISTQINRMTKQGLVSKRKNPDDKRKYDIVLIEKGQILFKEVTRDSIKMTFSCLSDEDKKELDSHLLRLMERVYSLLTKWDN